MSFMDKPSLRQQMRAQLTGLSVSMRRDLSARAVARLVEQGIWPKASSILGYVPLKDELDLLPALEAARLTGKVISLPRYLETEGIYCAAIAPARMPGLAKGAFGILEPTSEAEVMPLNRLDLVLVPGLAFDVRGKRLGRGKGFYDRLLAQVSGIKCGVALDEQIVQELPAEAHDIAMNYILTPTRWIAVQSVPSAGT